MKNKIAYMCYQVKMEIQGRDRLLLFRRLNLIGVGLCFLGINTKNSMFLVSIVKEMQRESKVRD